MSRRLLTLVAIAHLAHLPPCVASDLEASAEASLRNWPAWRGPLATGAAPFADPPLTWSETENVRWKVPLPGFGHSTPIVFGGRLFLTAAIAHGDPFEPRYSNAPGAHDNLPVKQKHKFVVLALDRADGTVLWQHTVADEIPHEGGHFTASQASNSPVADGHRVFVLFGSRGLYCFDLAGDLLWKRDLGRMQTKHGHGEGASPVVYRDTLVVNWDHEGESFIAAFDTQTGVQRWRAARQEVTSWATPIVVEVDEHPQIVVSGSDRVRGYDLATGEVIWQCGGLSANIVASPVAADGMVYVGSSYEIRAMLGIRLTGARGDLTETDHVVWSRRRGTPYVPSPLLYDGALYFLAHYQGILTRLDAPSGQERPGALRLNGIGDVYASPVAAADRVYITGRNGNTLVISHGDVPRALALNRLDDHFNASAALVDRELFLRGEKHLYAIAEDDRPNP